VLNSLVVEYKVQVSKVENGLVAQKIC